MTPRHLAGAAAFCVAISGAAATAAHAAAEAVPAVHRLPSIRRLTAVLARELGSTDAAERAAAWTEIALVADAVAGRACSLSAAGAAADAEACVVTTDARARDAAAYRLLALGYSPREAADVVAGRLSRRALDTARRMLMAGRGREAAARYLAGQYRDGRAADVAPVRPEGLPGWNASPFDALIAWAAARHGIDERLVRSVIAAESSFNPSARSPKGAVGLMQLMPATARALGANPLVPSENLDGGVRYLAWLLRTFGRTDLALVAYNAGPGFARRYARRETPLYGETRAYLARVSAGMAGARLTP